MERHGLHAMPELLGVPFAPHRALAAKPPRAPPFSHEVGGPGFEYAAHELVTDVTDEGVPVLGCARGLANMVIVVNARQSIERDCTFLA